MTVAYAALDRTLRYRDEDTKLYVAVFEDGQMFFSRDQPPLYDRRAQRVPVREVLPGSRVNIRYLVEQGIQPDGSRPGGSGTAPGSPFDPIPDDGHL